MKNIVKNFIIKYRPYLIMAGVFILAAILVNPRGEMALNDDWLYYDAVKQFDAGRLVYDQFFGPSLIFQIMYGFVVVKIFGWSFLALRLSTYVLSFLGGVFLYKLLTNLNLNKKIALLISLLFCLNPIWFNLSLTFMTDAPALSLAIIALYFFQKAFKTNSSKYFLPANLFVLAATFIRQNYLLMFATFAVFYVVKNFSLSKTKKIVVNVFLPALIFGLAYWFCQKNGWWPNSAMTLHDPGNNELLKKNLFKELIGAPNYLALFVFPIVIGLFFKLSKKSRAAAGALALLFASLNLWYFNSVSKFPFSGNILNRWGLGPNEPDSVLTGAPKLLITDNWSLFLTVVGGLLAGILLALFYKIIKSLFFSNEKINDSEFAKFALFNFLTQWLLILIFTSFDRYYLTLEIFLLIMLAIVFNKELNFSKYRLAVFGVLVMALIAVPLEHDYLAKNRLQWQIADSLVEQGTAIKNIDAGYEWLGYRWYRQRDPQVLPYYDPAKSWYVTNLFADVEPIFIISNETEKEDFNLKKTFEYEKFWGGAGELYLLEKNN